jgi:hypothetical protein
MKIAKILLCAATITAIAGVNTTTGSVARADGYGAAGCGLGGMLLGSKPGFMQVFAATTNGLFANQTFGITSGTLGCGAAPGPAVASAKSYVETNRQAFAKDVARGQGETIANLTELAGCADASSVGAKLQANFKAVFPSASASDTQVSARAVNLLKNDASLRCSKLI